MRPVWLRWTVWVLQGGTAIVFLAAGGAKLVNAPAMVDLFEQIGIGQWFRYLTGLLEITGAVLILIPRQAFRGALLLASIMACAVLAHLFLIGGSALPALILLAITATVAWLQRPA
ncbi:DoxX family protein [Pelagibacterium sp. HS1C4-1]|nr:DoxX family protein [Pelagibacterium xiamenense]MCD7059743.1 DoxX family protein [Pelagibacterium xiamenense]